MPTPRPQIPESLRPRPQPGLATPSRSESVVGPGSSYFKRRSFVYAAGFAVITIAGTLIGATLKSSKQAEEKKAIKEKVQADVGEQIAVLEETKLTLLQRKQQLEKKIMEVRERQITEDGVKVEREKLRAKGDELKRQMALERRG